MLENFKLRHLDIIAEEEVDYATLMIELNGYKNPSRYNRLRAFVKSYSQTHKFVEDVKKLDPKKISWNPDCKIKCPDDINTISFSAMMSIQTLSNNPGDKKIGRLMAELIAMTCYKENVEGDFDSKSDSFKDFVDQVYESPVIDMLGLYNRVDNMLIQNNLMWEQLFAEVYIYDKDYIEAGGNKMSNFNVINTVKAICQDFNVTFKEAWQMPYGVTQTNSLSKATAAHVQHKMSEIKEERMRMQRALKH